MFTALGRENILLVTDVSIFMHPAFVVFNVDIGEA
jgi:hypothetical protein